MKDGRKKTATSYCYTANKRSVVIREDGKEICYDETVERLAFELQDWLRHQLSHLLI
jgi:hypothetical protein